MGYHNTFRLRLDSANPAVPEGLRNIWFPFFSQSFSEDEQSKGAIARLNMTNREVLSGVTEQ
jgi:hypothetical protein